MRRLLVGVGAVVLSACQPEVTSFDAGPPRPFMQLQGPMVDGTGAVVIWKAPLADDALTLRVFDGETELVTEHPVVEGFQRLLPLSLPPGDYTAKLELLRDGGLLSSVSSDFHVYPEFALTRRVATHCERLTPLDDAATQFDCDGRLIDADGGVSGELLWGDVRVVRAPSGAVRWVLDRGELWAVTPRGETNHVAVSEGYGWAASADLAVFDDSVVRLLGTTLTSYPLQDHGAVKPFAAVSRDGHYAVAYVAPSPYPEADTPMSLCLLEPDPQQWEATSCTSLTAFFVRQESDGRLLLRSTGGLRWVDMFDAANPVTVALDGPSDGFSVGGQLLNGELQTFTTLTRTAPLSTVALKGLPDGGSVGFGASSEIIWRASAGETRWAPLP